MSKAGIIKDFKVLIALFEKATKNDNLELVSGKDWNRKLAYQNAISAICVVPGDKIKSIKVIKRGQYRPDKGKAIKREVYITTDEAENVLVPAGLGKSSVEKIDEYIKKGTIQDVIVARAWLKTDVLRLLSKPEQVLKDFQGIFNVGLDTATLWAHHYNQRINKSLSVLEWVNENKDNIPTVNNKTSSLTKAQKVGLQYYEDLHTRIPRHYIYIVYLMVSVVLARKFGTKSFRLVTAGSYRRGADDSGDIDLLLTSKVFNLQDAVKELEDAGIIVETLSSGVESKFTGIDLQPSLSGQEWMIKSSLSRSVELSETNFALIVVVFTPLTVT